MYVYQLQDVETPISADPPIGERASVRTAGAPVWTASELELLKSLFLLGNGELFRVLVSSLGAFFSQKAALLLDVVTAPAPTGTVTPSARMGEGAEDSASVGAGLGESDRTVASASSPSMVALLAELKYMFRLAVNHAGTASNNFPCNSISHPLHSFSTCIHILIQLVLFWLVTHHTWTGVGMDPAAPHLTMKNVLVPLLYPLKIDFY